MKKNLLALSLASALLLAFSSGAGAQVAPGTAVDLQNYLMPKTDQMVQISSGEVFSTQLVGDQAIQCKNTDCSSYQKIIQTNNGYGIQGENFWDSNGDGANEPNTTFQYRQADGSLMSWLPNNMAVGQTYSTGAFNVVGYHINGDQLIQFQSQQVDNMSLKLDYVGPIEFSTGITINNVAKVVVTSGPGAGEVFYYAEGVGWIGWEGPTGNNYVNQPIGTYKGPALKITKTATTLTCSSKSVADSSSRPAECNACFQTNQLTSSCATTWEAVGEATYYRDEGTICDDGQRYVTSNWGSKSASEVNIEIDPTKLTLPFAGKKGGEDEMKYLADYFEGTNEYYKNYENYPTDWIDHAGVIRKLTPYEYQSNLKKQLISRVDQISETSVHDYKVKYTGRICWDLPSIADAVVGFLQKNAPSILSPALNEIAKRNHYCLFDDSTLISKLPIIGSLAGSGTVEAYKIAINTFNVLSPADINYVRTNSYEENLSSLKNHLPPDQNDKDYIAKFEAWRRSGPAGNEDKWFRLWEAAPMVTREDSKGQIIPYAGLKPGDQFSITNPEATKNVQFPHLARLNELTKEIQKILQPSQTNKKIADNQDQPQNIAEGGNSNVLGTQVLAQASQFTTSVDSVNCTAIGWQLSCIIVASGTAGGGDVWVKLNGTLIGVNRMGPGMMYYPQISIPPGTTSYPVSVDLITYHNGETIVSGGCTVALDATGNGTCGGQVPIPAPVCGQPEAQPVASCQMDAISGEGDGLCCKGGVIKASLQAVEKIANTDYIACVNPSNPLDPCNQQITKEVTRKIGINVLQPYLNQIWSQSAYSAAGVFNIFRPSTLPVFEEKEAVGTAKIDYKFTQGEARSGNGDLYYRYLGGVQLAKEWVIRSLSPLKR